MRTTHGTALLDGYGRVLAYEGDHVLLPGETGPAGGWFACSNVLP
jgi:hypothetical protein